MREKKKLSQEKTDLVRFLGRHVLGNVRPVAESVEGYALEQKQLFVCGEARKVNDEGEGAARGSYLRPSRSQREGSGRCG